MVVSHTIPVSCDVTFAHQDNWLPLLTNAVQSDNDHVVFDLNDVTQIDGVGLATLAICQKTLEQSGRSLTLLTTNSRFQQLFHDTALGNTVFDDNVSATF